MNEHDADARAELRWLRHNQAALDRRLSRMEDSVLFRGLRAAGTFYSAAFRRNAGNVSREYRAWAARHARCELAPAPAWSYQPLISVNASSARKLENQTYRNWTLDQSAGEYQATLAAGVTLKPGALASAVAAMQEARPAQVYFDHELLDESGQTSGPVFKPDWSPVLAEGCDYLGPFVLNSREKRTGIAHVAALAYTSRLPLSFRSVARSPTRRPLVSVLICTRNAGLLARGLAALRAHTGYLEYEVVIVHHTGSLEDTAIERIATDQGAVYERYAGEFNFAAMNNQGTQAARGELLLFLNDDVEAREPGWLATMVAWLENSGIGAVGAKLLFAGGTIQHAGIATWVMDGAGHPGRNMTSSPYWPWLNCTREVSAVTGACLCMRRRDFDSLGGFDVQFPVNFNDVDLCLRLRERGLSVVIDTSVVLRHDESRTRKRGVAFEERRRFYLRWWKQVERVDPFYSPYLAQNNENLSLSEALF